MLDFNFKFKKSRNPNTLSFDKEAPEANLN